MNTEVPSLEKATLFNTVARSILFKRVSRLNEIDKWSLFFKGAALFTVLDFLISIPIALFLKGEEKPYSLVGTFLYCLFGDFILAVVCLIFVRGVKFSKMCNIVKYSYTYSYVFGLPILSLARLTGSTNIKNGLSTISGIAWIIGIVMMYRNFKHSQ